MQVFEFEIPAHSTRREWSVYIIVAKNRKSHKRKFYVGKVGDNRDGCNPIISRIGNHFSHNKIHSQMRNKLENTTDSDYKIHYASFGEYNVEFHKDGRSKINELERQLNLYLQKSIRNNDEILNPYKGVNVSKQKIIERKQILSKEDTELITLLAEKAVE